MLKLAVAHAKGEVKTFQSRFAYLIVVSVILIGSLISIVLVSELFLRWYYRDVLSSAFGRSYFYLRSGGKFYAEKNVLGVRGKHFDIPKKHALRVVVLGDSLAYGQGVWPYSKRFPEQTLKIFQEKYQGRDLEIINLGVPGMDLVHYQKYLTNFVFELKPDYVLYQWYTNDMNYRIDLEAFLAPPLISNKNLNKFLTENSVIYFLLQRASNQLRTWQGKQVNYTDYLKSKLMDPASEESLIANKLLIKLLDSLAKEKIDHGIVLFPSFSVKMEEYQLGFLHDKVLDICQERNLRCLDLREAFNRHDDPIEGLWANTFDPHPSELAHRVAAEEIFKFFGPGWAETIDAKEKTEQ